MKFYFEEIQDNTYVLYMVDCAYPLGKLWWCDECGIYHFESDFFNFYEDYDMEEDEFEYEEELLELVRLDLINDLSDKIKFMTEELSGLGRIYIY